LTIATSTRHLIQSIIAEAERSLPDVNVRVEALLERLGLKGEAITMRMTGCPNGARTGRALGVHYGLVL